MTEEQQKIVVDNIKLVPFTISKINIIAEDDMQVFYDDGIIGLINGAKTYDATKGFTLSTYLCICIRHEVTKGIYLRSMNKRKTYHFTKSYNQKIGDTNEEYMYFIKDEKRFEDEVENKILVEEILKKLEDFDERKQTMFKMYFGIGYPEMNFTEIAEHFGLSRTWPNVTIKKMIKKIKEQMEE